MKRITSLMIITFVLIVLVTGLFAGCGGGSSSGGGNTGLPGADVPTDPNTTPPKIPTPNLIDPTPTPVYTTDPNEFGPIQSGKCSVNAVTYNINASAKRITNLQKCELAIVETNMVPQEDVVKLEASGVLVLLPNVDVKIYNTEGGTLKYSGKTGSSGDWKLENIDPGTYWIEFSKSGYTSIKRSQEFKVGVINICNGIFNSP